jgi:SSS family solute:Na+ symporter
MFIAPKIKIFENALSVGEIMGILYGPNVRIFTGSAAVLVCGGIAGAQFSAFGYITQILLNVPQEIGAILGAITVILYSANGGIKSVVANDVLHFCVLIIAIPLVFILTVIDIGGFGALLDANSYYEDPNSISLIGIFGLFLSFFFGETLVPPYVQRLLIGKTTLDTMRGTMMSGILSILFFLIIGLIGIAAHKIKPDLNPNLAIPYIIAHIMPIGIKGLAIAGLMAVLMSSADSFLNSAAVSASRDVISPLIGQINGKNELIISKIMTIIVGAIGLIFAVSVASVIEILLYAYNFWTPMILVPLVAGILGYKANQTVFWSSSFAGAFTTILMHILAINTYGVDYSIFGVINCAIVFFCGLHLQIALSPSQSIKIQ